MNNISVPKVNEINHFWLNPSLTSNTAIQGLEIIVKEKILISFENLADLEGKVCRIEDLTNETAQKIYLLILQIMHPQKDIQCWKAQFNFPNKELLIQAFAHSKTFTCPNKQLKCLQALSLICTNSTLPKSLDKIFDCFKPCIWDYRFLKFLEAQEKDRREELLCKIHCHLPQNDSPERIIEFIDLFGNQDVSTILNLMWKLSCKYTITEHLALLRVILQMPPYERNPETFEAYLRKIGSRIAGSQCTDINEIIYGVSREQDEDIHTLLTYVCHDHLYYDIANIPEFRDTELSIIYTLAHFLKLKPMNESAPLLHKFANGENFQNFKEEANRLSRFCPQMRALLLILSEEQNLSLTSAFASIKTMRGRILLFEIAMNAGKKINQILAADAVGIICKMEDAHARELIALLVDLWEMDREDIIGFWVQRPALICDLSYVNSFFSWMAAGQTHFASLKEYEETANDLLALERRVAANYALENCSDFTLLELHELQKAYLTLPDGVEASTFMELIKDCKRVEIAWWQKIKALQNGARLYDKSFGNHIALLAASGKLEEETKFLFDYRALSPKNRQLCFFLQMYCNAPIDVMRKFLIPTEEVKGEIFESIQERNPEDLTPELMKSIIDIYYPFDRENLPILNSNIPKFSSKELIMISKELIKSKNPQVNFMVFRLFAALSEKERTNRRLKDLIALYETVPLKHRIFFTEYLLGVNPLMLLSCKEHFPLIKNCIGKNDRALGKLIRRARGNLYRFAIPKILNFPDAGKWRPLIKILYLLKENDRTEKNIDTLITKCSLFPKDIWRALKPFKNEKMTYEALLILLSIFPDSETDREFLIEKSALGIFSLLPDQARTIESLQLCIAIHIASGRHLYSHLRKIPCQNRLEALHILAGSPNEIRNPLQYVLSRSEPIRSKMHDILLQELLHLQTCSDGAAIEFIRKFFRNYRNYALNSEDPLYIYFAQVLTAIDQEMVAVPKYPCEIFNKHRRLQAKPCFPILPQLQTAFGHIAAFCPMTLQQRCNETEPLMIKDLPREITKNTLADLFEQITDPDSQAVKNFVLNQSILPSLLDVQGDENTLISIETLYLFAICKMILDERDPVKRNELLLSQMSQISACPVGQTYALCLIYNQLDHKYRTRSKTASKEQKVYDIADRAIQKYLGDVFASDEFLQKAAEDKNIAQASHLILYLKNLLCRNVGLLHSITYDMYTLCLPDSIMGKTENQLADLFFQCCSVKEFVTVFRKELSEGVGYEALQRVLSLIAPPGREGLEFYEKCFEEDLVTITSFGALMLLKAMGVITACNPENVRDQNYLQTLARLKKISIPSRSNLEEIARPYLPTTTHSLHALWMRNFAFAHSANHPGIQRLCYSPQSDQKTQILQEWILERDRVLAKAHPESGKLLFLCGKRLTTLPECLQTRVNTVHLRCTNSYLTQIPPWIEKFTNLQSLNFTNNALGNLPVAIFHLEKLDALYLDSNQICSLPEQISHLKNLETLTLARNPLQYLPESILQCDKLKSLCLLDTFIPLNCPIVAKLKQRGVNIIL